MFLKICWDLISIDTSNDIAAYSWLIVDDEDHLSGVYLGEPDTRPVLFLLTGSLCPSDVLRPLKQTDDSFGKLGYRIEDIAWEGSREDGLQRYA